MVVEYRVSVHLIGVHFLAGFQEQGSAFCLTDGLMSLIAALKHIGSTGSFVVLELVLVESAT